VETGVSRGFRGPGRENGSDRGLEMQNMSLMTWYEGGDCKMIIVVIYQGQESVAHV